MSAEQVIGRVDNSPTTSRERSRHLTPVQHAKITLAYTLDAVKGLIPTDPIRVFESGLLVGGTFSVADLIQRSFTNSAIVLAANRECVDQKGSKNGTYQVVGKQVWFFNLVGREGIFDKGTDAKPLDPWLEEPALGGYIQIYPPEKQQGEKVDPNIKPIGVSTAFSTTEPKIPNIKLTDSGKNLAWAYVKWDAAYNTRITLKDGRVLCGYEGWIASTQHPENLVPLAVPGLGSVNPYWFGREMKNGEDFIRRTSTGIGRDMPPSVESIREAYKRFLQKEEKKKVEDSKTTPAKPAPEANGGKKEVQPSQNGQEKPQEKPQEKEDKQQEVQPGGNGEGQKEGQQNGQDSNRENGNPVVALVSQRPIESAVGGMVGLGTLAVLGRWLWRKLHP